MTIYTQNQIDLLQSAFRDINYALYHGKRTRIEDSILEIRNKIPEIEPIADSKIIAIMSAKGRTNIKKKSIKLISYDELIDNANGYLIAINEALCSVFPYNLSEKTYKTIYFNEDKFHENKVLYEQDGSHLTVANVLSVAGYVVKIAEAVAPEDKDIERASATITVFKSIHAALTNEKQDKPTNKLLHLANDYLTNAIKPNLSGEGKQVSTGISLMVDLVIDFFIKG